MNQTGVYAITCLPTGKQYVGSTVRVFRRRFNDHRSLLRSNQHHCRHLQRAWNKHGEHAFSFAPLIICRPEDAVMYEQLAMDALRPKLNSSPTAGNTLGVTQSDQHRARCSARMQKEWQAGREDSLAKFRQSPEAGEKLSAARKRLWAEGRYAARKSRSDAKTYLVHGEKLTKRQIAEKYSLSWGTVCYRISHGFTGDDLAAPTWALCRGRK